MTKKNPPPKSGGLKLNIFTILSTISIIVLLVLGICMSFIWPTDWNPVLNSLFLNIISSLIGVMVGALIAIFIVDRYIDQRHREVAEAEAKQEKMYKAYWWGHHHGDLAMLTFVIMHLSLFVSYGQKRYLEILSSHIVPHKIPETIEKFIPFLLNSLLNDLNAESAPNHLSDERIFKNMNDEDAARITEVFLTNEPKEMLCSIKDLSCLLNQLNGYRNVIDDDIFLLQPFLARSMGLAQAMLKTKRELTYAINDIRHILLKQNSKEAVSSIQLDKDITTKFCKLGQAAITIIKILWSYQQGSLTDMDVSH